MFLTGSILSSMYNMMKALIQVYQEVDPDVQVSLLCEIREGGRKPGTLPDGGLRDVGLVDLGLQEGGSMMAEEEL